MAIAKILIWTLFGLALAIVNLFWTPGWAMGYLGKIDPYTIGVINVYLGLPFGIIFGSMAFMIGSPEACEEDGKKTRNPYPYLAILFYLACGLAFTLMAAWKFKPLPPGPMLAGAILMMAGLILSHWIAVFMRRKSNQRLAPELLFYAVSAMACAAPFFCVAFSIKSPFPGAIVP